jgi:hypothetical protein
MDDQLKQQLLPAIIVFCWTLLGYVFVRYFMSAVGWDMGTFLVQAIIGAVLGLVTGGLTAFVMSKRR